MSLPLILIIDEDLSRTRDVKNILEFIDFKVVTANSTDYLSIFNDQAEVKAVFVGAGIKKQASSVKTVVEMAGEIPVVFVIEKGGILQVPTAIQNMVSLIVEWPVTYTIFKDQLKKLMACYDQAQTNLSGSFSKGLSGNTQGIQKTRELIDQVAGSEATVLILGESGTGKEVIARSLHQASARNGKPFVPVNCGAIPGELLESELFGHEKGAFTGALTSRKGRFEMAEGGTLFLDEIGDMPMTMQVKLLRVLQERTFERVGSNQTIHCNVRIIAATHRNLENEIEANRFREDLFYRLNVFPIEVPPLRDRVEDIPLLAADLIAKIEGEGRGSIRFTAAALDKLQQHRWPGNVRELENLVERLVIMHPQGEIDFCDLPEKYRGSGPDDGLGEDGFFMRIEKQQAAEAGEMALPIVNDSSVRLPEQGLDLKEYLNSMEIDLINQALKESNGVVAHAAKRLNMRRTTLVEKLKKFDL